MNFDKVQQVHSDGALALHTRSLKYGKLGQGVLVKVSPSLVKRRKSHFHSLPCGCSIILGNNGYVWIYPTVFAIVEVHTLCTMHISLLNRIFVCLSVFVFSSTCISNVLLMTIDIFMATDDGGRIENRWVLPELATHRIQRSRNHRQNSQLHLGSCRAQDDAVRHDRPLRFRSLCRLRGR